METHHKTNEVSRITNTITGNGEEKPTQDNISHEVTQIEKDLSATVPSEPFSKEIIQE